MQIAIAVTLRGSSRRGAERGRDTRIVVMCPVGSGLAQPRIGCVGPVQDIDKIFSTASGPSVWVSSDTTNHACLGGDSFPK
jgi:hypothetical protein